MNYVLDADRTEWNQWLKRESVPAYRFRQLQEWIFKRRARGFAEMTSLPLGLRRTLAADFEIWSTRVVAHRHAVDGTEKLLLQLARGGQIECVLIRQGDRRTACVSSQVGCAMGCVFCASGLNGVERNLTCGEIVEQLLQLQFLLPASDRISHIVMMGMGEPLANLDAVLRALSLASHADGLGISQRRITISTVGLPAAMDRLAAEDSAYRLAISLHAPNDALRDQLVPINSRIGLNAILQAADRFVALRGKRITFEYVLLAEVNDHPEHARELVRLLRHRHALLNVIPYNPVAGLGYRTPSRAAIDAFRQILEAGSIRVQFRERKGDSIDAACGQLRRVLSATPPPPLVPIELA